jgi:hypothetical protein
VRRPAGRAGCPGDAGHCPRPTAAAVGPAPHRLVRTGGAIIPEEWKKSLKVWPSQRAQLGVAFVVVEDRLGVRPTHGFVVLGGRDAGAGGQCP